MRLKPYFERIGFSGKAAPDPDTLRGLMQAHIQAVPFENLDVQLGRPLTTAVEEAFEKIVGNSRGGWCYQQNGLFGWALSQIGFDVTRVAAAVMREERGDGALDNHLCLLVRCPDHSGTWLADVGFGGGLYQPIPLTQDNHWHDPFRVSLRRIEDGWWQFTENMGNGDFSFDFAPVVADETALSNKCDALQTDPESGFVLNLVAQLREPNRHLTLRGRVLSVATANGIETETITTAAELQDALRDLFRLDVPDIVDLWPRICERHESLFGENN
jgi:N-hydroxyarylamine O-acetyltransferase